MENSLGESKQFAQGHRDRKFQNLESDFKWLAFSLHLILQVLKVCVCVCLLH